MQFGNDDIIEQIDFDNLFDNVPEDLNLFASQDSSLQNYSPDSIALTIDEMHELLMRDDDPDDGSKIPDSEFMMDFLLDTPVGESGGEVVDGKNSSSSEEQKDGDEKNNKNEKDDDDNDINSKKRKRQLRNRDAAVRSRERKKSYVKDLELKSRYFEGECKRLGMMLNCYLAENYALKNSLIMMKKSVGDEMRTGQESAVLFLESLLLGSLLWFPKIIIILRWLLLLLLPSHVHLLPREIVVNLKRDLKDLKAPMPPNKGGVILALGKKCRGSRSRMKGLEFYVNKLVFVF